VGGLGGRRSTEDRRQLLELRTRRRRRSSRPGVNGLVGGRIGQVRDPGLDIRIGVDVGHAERLSAPVPVGQTERVGALLYQGDCVREPRARPRRWKCRCCPRVHKNGGVGRLVVRRCGCSSRTKYDYGIKSQDGGAQESSPNLCFDKYAIT
jgi:hypothetical protein